MRFMPLTRFLVAAGAVALIIPLLKNPTARYVLALLASGALALAFALEDYGPCSSPSRRQATRSRLRRPGQAAKPCRSMAAQRAVVARASTLTAADRQAAP